MNVRLTILLIVVLVLFGGTATFVFFNQESEPKQDQAWLWRVDDNSLTGITVTFEGETVEYRKKEGGVRWFIIEEDGQRQVYQDKWSGTPLLLSGPKVNRTLADEMENPAQYGLDPPITSVRLTERTGREYEAHIGLVTPDGENQYARLVGSPKLFTVPQIWARVVNRLVFQPPYPRLYDTDVPDKQLLDTSKQNVFRFEVTVGEETVHYVWNRPTDEWYIFDRAADATEEDDILIPDDLWEDQDVLLENPNVIDTVSEDLKDPENYGLEPPMTIVWLATDTNQNHEFYLGDATEDGTKRYAITSGQPELYTVPAEWAAAIERLATDPPYPPGEGS